jgi:hypothetical protein
MEATGAPKAGPKFPQKLWLLPLAAVLKLVVLQWATQEWAVLQVVLKAAVAVKKPFSTLWPTLWPRLA